MSTVITAVQTINEDTFYTLVTGVQVETVVAETLLELIQQGVSIEVSTNEEGEVAEELYDINLDYMEVSDEDEVVDVYRHQVSITNGEVSIKEAQHEKEYKSVKSAVAYAEKQNTLLVKLT